MATGNSAAQNGVEKAPRITWRTHIGNKVWTLPNGGVMAAGFAASGERNTSWAQRLSAKTGATEWRMTFKGFRRPPRYQYGVVSTAILLRGGDLVIVGHTIIVGHTTVTDSILNCSTAWILRLRTDNAKRAR